MPKGYPTLKVMFAIFALLLIGGISYIAWPKFFHQSEPAFCAQEAKQCPDGSYVGRTGPNCEFAQCPGENNDLWKTMTDSKTGITFQYPKTLLTEYIHTVGWPPQVQVLNEPFACIEAGSETARAGKTEKRFVDDREYCRTSIVEGAAGSIYTNYAYAFPLYSTGSTQADRKTVIFTFSLQAVQCANYDDPRKTACENERSSFDLDSAVDRMAKTVQIEAISPKISDSGIRGTVLLGPTCPVERIPPDPVCADKPYKTNLTLTTADQSRVITEFNSDANGKFTVKIQPGEYAIRSAAAANILPYCASNNTIKVSANMFTDATVFCDTGIR